MQSWRFLSSTSDIVWFQVDECKDLLAIKKEEYDKLQDREKALMQTLSNTIGDNNKFEAFLMKVFKKKIKRVKKKVTEEGQLAAQNFFSSFC